LLAPVRGPCKDFFVLLILLQIRSGKRHCIPCSLASCAHRHREGQR
jgi:hypothetical protein